MPAQSPVDYYAVLGVSPSSSFTEIRKAFCKLSLSAHPDRHDKSEFEEAHKKFVLISAAYNVLKDKESREEYDATRPRVTRKPTAAQSSHAAKQCSHGFDHYDDEDGDYFDEDDADEDPGTDFAEDSWFYSAQVPAADHSFRRHGILRRRACSSCVNGKYSAQWQTDSTYWRDVQGDEDYDPLKTPRHEDEERIPPYEYAFRFNPLNDSLRHQLLILELYVHTFYKFSQSLNKFDTVKGRASRIRARLRFIKDSFTAIITMVQVGLDVCDVPNVWVWLTEADITLIKTMETLEEHFKDLCNVLPRDKSSVSSEQEASTTSKLLLMGLMKCSRLCE